MREDEPAAKGKLARREIAVFARKVVIESKRKLRHLACRRALLGVRQAGGVAVDRAGHPELARLCGHAVGKGRLAAGQAFGENRGGVIGGFGDDTENKIVNLDRIARYEVELGRALARRLARHRQILVEPKPVRVQRLERQV